MKLKQLDSILDKVLWILFALLVVAAFFWTRSIKAPDLEYVESEQIPYVYTSDDGEKYNSYYLLAWKHENFAKPYPVAADPNNGNIATIKPEYIDDYKAVMAESKYPFYTRWTWVIFGLLVIVAAILVYFAGGWLRDAILYGKLKSKADFTDCAYFLHEDRQGFKDATKRLIARNVGDYVRTKSQQLKAQYKPEFAEFIIKILNDVARREDTQVPIYLTYTDKTTDHKQYLLSLRSYWDGQIGKHVNAEKNVKAINDMLEKNYISINLLLSEGDIAGAVCRQLDKLFVDILGGEVLTFKSYSKPDAFSRFRDDDRMYIDIVVYNHSTSFTWSGSAVPSGTEIPGLEVEFKVYHLVNRQPVILWHKYLVPKCNYTAKDSEFASSELYKNMVISTIDSFNDKN